MPVESDNSEEYAIQTLTAMAPTATMTPTVQIETTVPPTQEYTATPTTIPTKTPPIPTPPLPKEVMIEGITVEYQKANNCGPANLSMVLNYWGWEGDQTDTEKC